MMLLFTLLVALLMDHFLGEARRFHPLVGFANVAKFIERKLNHGTKVGPFWGGIVAWCVLVLPLPLLYYWLITVLPYYLQLALDIYIVYWAVALNSLTQHGLQIYHPLRANDLAQAQHYCGYIVSRDTRELDEQAVCRATTESMLENGHDGVTATLIYFAIGGAPLVIMHRLSNTLDAMWGYRNARYQYFGKCSARMDDLLGFVSGKITVLLFAVLGLLKGCARDIIVNAYRQGQTYKSHNGGWVMAAGATLINVRLGGASARYFGKQIHSPELGTGDTVQDTHIVTSLAAVRHAVWLWLLLLAIWQVSLSLT